MPGILFDQACEGQHCRVSGATPRPPLAFSGGDSTISLPTGCSIFPKEIVPTPRSWAEKRYENIVYWNELDKGGHFAAFEQPEIFVGELRACFALMR